MIKKNFSVGKAIAIIAVFTLVSRIVGFVRELLLASRFGAGETLDIYYTAFRLPDTVYNLLILGTLSVVFIPVFNEYYLKDKAKAQRIANSVLNGAAAAMLIICAILFIFARPLTQLVAPGFEGDKFEATVTLTRLMLISPVIFTVSSIFSSYLTSLKEFLVISLAPVLYNLGIIFGLFVFYPRWGLIGLGYGVLLGAVLHLGIQVFESWRRGYIWRPVLDLVDPGVKKIAWLFIPRVLSLDISYISLLVASVIGSTLASGSIAVFNLANNLQAVAVGIFALSTATAIFPVLSELHAQTERQRFAVVLRDAIIRILFFMIPVAIMMLLFRAHIVRLAYGYGNFDWDSTILTFNTVGILSFAVVSQSLVPLFARAFYARQNTKTPLIIGLISMAFNATLSYLAAQYYGVEGISLGFTIASVINGLLLFIILRLKLGDELTDLESNFDLPLLTATMKIILATVIMGIVSYSLIYAIGPRVNTHTVVGIFTQASLSGLGGILVYAALTYWMGFGEVRYVKQLLFRQR
jgi:putative peptidoglycan lipid II flippase